MIDEHKGAVRKPVMVFAGNFRLGSTESGLADGFRRAGWVVQEIDVRQYVSGSQKSRIPRIASRVANMGWERAYRERILKECEFLRPDVVFFVKGQGVTREFLGDLKQHSSHAAVYYPDVSFNHPGIHLDSLLGYDLFVTTKSFQVEWLQERIGREKAVWVPHGYTDKLHSPIYSHLNDEDRQTDVQYAGNFSEYKREWMAGLIESNKNLKFRIIGNRWEPELDLPKVSFLGEVSGVGYAQSIQMARINIALHFGKTDSQWQDLVSRRTFEIPACKGFMLHIDNDEVRELFEVGAEIDVFSSAEELSDKVKYYLDKPSIRQRMTERAYARCVPAYGHVSRAMAITKAMLEKGVAPPTMKQ